MDKERVYNMNDKMKKDVLEWLRLFNIDDENDEDFHTDGELLDLAYDIICDVARLPGGCLNSF